MNLFAELGVNDSIISALSALGFESPTPVQERVIPVMLEKQGDLVSLAQTGTGKTAAFGIPLIQLLDSDKRHPQSLVLCPTRELCVQVARDLEAFSKNLKNISVLAVYGGAPIDKQIRALRKGVHVVVATPGRLKDLLNRNAARLDKVRTVVFDEADEMLQMGFQDELTAILACTPKQKNTLLFSATMPREVAAMAKRYMTNPQELTIGTRNAGADNVRHEYYLVHPRNRYQALRRIVDNNPDNYSIVFCRTRSETNDIANKLIHDGYNCDALHGELSQAQRDHVMGKFRIKHLQILVATDVAARGLDVNDLSHVINYNLPDEIAGYTHRSGRTGRAGRTGVSIALVSTKELYRLQLIERKIQKKFSRCSIPSGEEICRKQLGRMIDAVAAVEVDHSRIDPLYEEIAEKLESLSREELIKRFISMEFNRFLKDYKDAPDLNVSEASARQRGKDRKGGRELRRKQRPTQKMTNFRLNAGRRQGIAPQGLIAKINEIPDVGRIKIGQIDILRNSATFEADSRYTAQILQLFQQAEVSGKSVSISMEKAARTGAPARFKHKGKAKRRGKKAL